MTASPAPLLTVVVTAHHTRYLTEAMTSVAAQTSTGFDLVCCTDTTGSPGVTALYDGLLPHVRCREARVLEVEGGTAGRVRNAGFAAARTPWIAYLDGDDLLHPDALARLVHTVRHAEADIVSTGMTRITADGRPEPWPQSLTYRPPRWIYRTDPDSVGHPTFFNQLLAIRRELWEAHPFDETTNGEDIDFMLHQLLAGRFHKLPEALYGYRDTAGSFSKQEFPQGDLCTNRYREGYYADLFDLRYRPELAANFSDEPEPAR
ncbi:glycosyltransferase [Streptomyces sp. YIM 98790]|uniref:glycosyltransferase family 2 protein n=1 Tax=Streptomyces sp. YIM 98790 TaxID=2689077 RepID=UPI00140C33B7|nr:glycosyltransferase [Streptomyces sp. YIM 98790]